MGIPVEATDILTCNLSFSLMASLCHNSGGQRDKVVMCAILSEDGRLQYLSCFCSFRYSKWLTLLARPICVPVSVREKWRGGGWGPM